MLAHPLIMCSSAGTVALCQFGMSSYSRRPASTRSMSSVDRGSTVRPRCVARDEEVQVSVGALTLAGHLIVPEQPTGIVVFTHGSGSSRHSPGNHVVADVLNRAGFFTLLFDLLTPEEECLRANVFDVSLLAGRLVDVSNWLAAQPETTALPIGYFEEAGAIEKVATLTPN